VSATHSPGAKAVAEVRARHAFFAEWFAGRSEEGRLDTAMTAFAADFRHVAPDGVERDRTQLASLLETLRGSRPEAGFDIAVEFPRVVFESADGAVVTYVEVQSRGDPPRRISTAVFTVDARAPHGVLWRHVQETRLAPEAG